VRIPTSATGEAASPAVPVVRAFPPARAQQAFTLLEMMLVLLVAAIILGVSAPAMQRLIQSAQYRGAVSDIVSELNAARIQAIRTGAVTDVLIDPVARSIKRNQTVHELPESLELKVLGSRELNRDGAGVIRFYADGASSGGYVDVAHVNGRGVQVQVDWLLGRVTLCKKDCRET